MTQRPPASERLRRGDAVAYAAPAPALALIGTVFYVFLPKHYSDVVGVDLGVLGLVVLVSRFWDALIDPLAGHLSDRTRTHWGRRRPWIGIASLPLAAVFVGATAPPPSLETVGATIWFAACAFLLFLFWTAVVIPYEALGPELTFDYNERNRLFGWREGASLLGTVLAVLLPELLRRQHTVAWLTDARLRMTVTGGIGALILLPAVAFQLAWLRERTLTASQIPDPITKEAVYSVWRNRPFRVLLTAYTIGALGSQLPATLMLFYVEYVLGSTRGGLYLLLYLATGFAFIPLWVRLGSRFEKRTVWIAAMAVNTLAFFGVAFLGPGDLPLFGVLVALSASGLGGVMVLPAAMEADVIDYDEAHTGVRREGVFSGIWSVCKKLAAALGAGVGLALLDAAGYVPNQPQPDSARLALRLLYAVAPCLCNVAAIAIAWRYPLTREDHAALRRSIQTRQARKTPASVNRSPELGDAGPG